jgi:hypothetical protein
MGSLRSSTSGSKHVRIRIATLDFFRSYLFSNPSTIPQSDGSLRSSSYSRLSTGTYHRLSSTKSDFDGTKDRSSSPLSNGRT